MAKIKNFEFSEGETWIVRLAARDAAGIPLDLTGGSAYWGFSTESAALILAVAGAIIDAEAGLVDFILSPADHILISHGEYYHEMRVTLADSTISAQLRGRLTVGVSPFPAAPFVAGGSYLGEYVSIASLSAAHPVGVTGEWAAIIDGTGNAYLVSWNGAAWVYGVPGGLLTNASLADMAQATIKGRAAGAGTGDPQDLTGTQVAVIVDAMVGDSGSGGTKGLAPAPAAGDTAAGRFLKADGTWAVPPGTAGVGAPDTVDYLVRTPNATLSAERVVTDSTTVIFDWSTAGVVKANVVGGTATASTPSDFKDSCAVATTANITLSGEQTIDGVLTSASRVLVKDQTTGSQNGIYVSAAGAWTRSTDADVDAEVTPGMLVLVENGTVNADLVFILATNGVIVLGATVLTFQAIAVPANATVGKTVSTTTYTAILTDVGKRLNLTHASAKTITIPPQTGGGGVAFPVNTELEIYNSGAGLATIAPGSGVTFNSNILTIPQYYMAQVKKRANPNSWDVIGVYATANLTKGFTATAYDAGTKSSGTFTPDPANGNLQRAVNGGAHTLAPPSVGTGDAAQITIQYTNNASAGALTTSGFTKVTGSTLTTTNGDDFMMFCSVINGFSLLNVVALQ